MLSIKVALGGGVYNYYSENGGGSRPVRPKMGGVSMWYPTGADLRYPPPRDVYVTFPKCVFECVCLCVCVFVCVFVCVCVRVSVYVCVHVYLRSRRRRRRRRRRATNAAAAAASSSL